MCTCSQWSVGGSAGRGAVVNERGTNPYRRCCAVPCRLDTSSVEVLFALSRFPTAHLQCGGRLRGVFCSVVRTESETHSVFEYETTDVSNQRIKAEIRLIMTIAVQASQSR